MIVATLPHTFPPRSAVLGWGRSLGIWSVSGTCAKQSTNAHRCDTGRPEIPAGSRWPPRNARGGSGSCSYITASAALLSCPVLRAGKGLSVLGPGGWPCARPAWWPLCAACPSLAALTPPAEVGAGAHTNRLVWGLCNRKTALIPVTTVDLKVCVCAA